MHGYIFFGTIIKLKLTKNQMIFFHVWSLHFSSSYTQFPSLFVNTVRKVIILLWVVVGGVALDCIIFKKSPPQRNNFQETDTKRDFWGRNYLWAPTDPQTIAVFPLIMVSFPQHHIPTFCHVSYRC